MICRFLTMSYRLISEIIFIDFYYLSLIVLFQFFFHII